MAEQLPLSAKLSRPRTARFQLPRPHLTTLLREGLGRRLTMLIASAGHGKTSTLAHFLSELPLPVLWLQLDPGDSDLHTFLGYLATGLTRELGGGDRLLKALASGAALTQPLPVLAADLNDCPGDVALVLDDFHLIDRDSAVVPLIAGLLPYLPERVHLYVCSRSPLPFSTSRLKVTQEAGEITESDLRFTPPEVQAFLEHMTGARVEGEQLDQICHLTEGWSAALVLLATGMRRRGGLDSLLGGALPPDLFAYLADEVFASLPPSMQRFMEESSVLDTCSPDACDAILDRQDSAALLAQLMGANLLLTQLGPDAFRYHHLLQRFLHERLRARESHDFARLHRQAAEYYLAREQPEEAIKHFLRGGWVQEAAHLVEGLAPRWLRTHRLERLKGLLNHLPANAREQYPWITLCEARLQLNAGQADYAIGTGRLALTSFETAGDARGVVQAQILLGEALLVRDERAAAEEAVRLAAASLRPEFRHEEGLLLQLRSTIQLHTKGPTGAAEEDLRRALSLFVELGDLPGEASTSDLLGILRAQMGDYASAIQYLERSVTLLKSLGEPPHEVGFNLAWAYGEMGRFHDSVSITEPMLTLSSRKMRKVMAATSLLRSFTRLGEFTKAMALAPVANGLVEEMNNNVLKTDLTVEISGLYRLSGQSQASVPFASEALQLARQTWPPQQVEPTLEAVLLHLFHTGNAAAADRITERALTRLASKIPPIHRVMLTLARAVAQFRLTRTESRPEAVRLLQEGLSECQRRGYTFIALREWPLAMAASIYGLAYLVHPDVCLELVNVMAGGLPPAILQAGVPVADPEARLLPAAWQALPDDTARDRFASLLNRQDRRRVVNLSTGPASVRIQVLGPLTVTVGNTPIDVKALRKRKSGLLLALLLAEESPMPRERVMDRLWADLDGSGADTSLRVTLHHLRRLLEPHLGGKSKSRYIQTEGGLIWFARQPEVQIDLDLIREELRKAEDHRTAGHPAGAATHLEAAIRLYRGDLAEDDPYAEGLEGLREAWRRRCAEALDWLSAYYWEDLQDAPKAVLTIQRRLQLDPAHEASHQLLIRIHLETGQIAKARQQYLACREALATYLNVEPSRGTESLLQVAMDLESEQGVPSDRTTSRQTRSHRR